MDAVVKVTDSNAFRAVKIARVKSLMNTPVMVDLANT